MMKLLLCKNVAKLGIVGDVVEVAAGYGRNYLLPHGLAMAPTKTNMRRLAGARKQAELEQIRFREQLESLAKRLDDVEVTIRARANEDGLLYGSVGPREIASALVEEGLPVVPDQVALPRPIRHLDNVPVEIRLADDLCSTIKVWVVREKSDMEEAETTEPEGASEPLAGMEAGEDDHNDDE